MSITVDIVDKRAALKDEAVIVCGNSDYEIKFTFDSEWDGLDDKTAHFVYTRKGKIRRLAVGFTGDTVPVPPLANTREVSVGVSAGSLHTTTSARIPCELSIRCMANL